MKTAWTPDTGAAERGASHMVDASPKGEDATSGFDYEARATKLHAVSCRRVELFRHAIMADKVMDVMLTALVAHEQDTPLTRKAVAMANQLSQAQADEIIAGLISAHLLAAGAAAESVQLSAVGVQRMRAYVRRFGGADE